MTWGKEGFSNKLYWGKWKTEGKMGVFHAERGQTRVLKKAPFPGVTSSEWQKIPLGYFGL